MTRKVMMTDPHRCNGCGLCQMACTLVHDRVCNPHRSRIRIIDLEAQGRYFPLHCRHCENPPCAAACPQEAIYRDEGLIRIVVDYGRCIGCGMCVHACPFGAVGFDSERGRPFKCDLCGGDPECVRFCAPEALRFVEADVLLQDWIRESAMKNAGVRRSAHAVFSGQ